MDGPATVREGLLVAACVLLRPRVAVEIGVGNGRHTMLFAAALPLGGLIYGIDMDIRPATRNIDAFTDRIVLLEGRSHDRIPELPDGIGFAYVDGDHSYEAVLGDVRLLWPKMAPNGVIAFDDVNNDWEEPAGVSYGVRRAIASFSDDFSGRGMWRDEPYPRKLYFPWGPGVMLLQKPGEIHVSRSLTEAREWNYAIP